MRSQALATVLAALLLLSACATSAGGQAASTAAANTSAPQSDAPQADADVTPPPQVGAPPADPTPTPQVDPVATTPTPDTSAAATLAGQLPPPDLILHNAQVVTVDAGFSIAEAVAIADGKITAVGRSQELLRTAGTSTIVADLGGRSVLPGFVETHTHLMQAVADDTTAMMAGHDGLVASGITTAGMPSVLPEQLEFFEKLDANGLIKLRAHMYVAYNSVCGEPLGDFYLQNPFDRDPDLRLALAGVKIFADGGVCGGPAMSIPYLDSTPEELYNSGWAGNGQLYVTDAEITKVLQQVDAAGGQTVIHAIGDIAIATALRGIDKAGQLTNPHQLHHNSWASLVDPDLLTIYGSAGLIPVVQLMPWARACEPGRSELWQSIIAPRALAVVEDRVAINQANPGIRWAWHGDGPSVIGSPLQQMFSIVSQGSTDGTEVCYPPAWTNFPTVSVEEALQMTTINAAAAMGYEEYFGSIEVGKVADLVVLEHDPFDVDPEIGLARNKPLATIIDGVIEYCVGALCRDLSGATDIVAPPASGTCIALGNVIGAGPLGDGLHGWWPGDGTAEDIFGSNDGALIEGAAFDTGAVGQAFALNGGAIALGAQPALDAGFTLEGWLVFDGGDVDEFMSIFNNGQLFLRKNNAAEGNGLAVFVATEDGSLEPRAQAIGAVPIGVWVHVAATWDGTTLAIYQNGELQQQVERPDNLTDATVTAQIGRGEAGGTLEPQMHGRIDEFTLFTRALQPLEIAAIHGAGSNGKCQP